MERRATHRWERIVERARPWTSREALLACGRILAGGYALGSFGFFASAPSETVDRAIVANALSGGEHRRLAVVLAAALALAVAYALVFAWRGARQNPTEPTRDLVLASYEPFLLAPLAFWPLYEANVASHVRLFAIVSMAAVSGLALHLFATRSPRGRIFDVIDAHVPERLGAALALVMGLAHGALMAHVAIQNFDMLWNGWDLAIYAQVHWNIATTGIPWSTTYTDQSFNHYAIHFSPIYHLTSLLYRLHPSPATLLVLENLALGAGTLPVFLLGKHFTKRTTASLMLAAAYLLNPCAHGLALHDFHEIVFFVPLMLGLLWATCAERRTLTWVLAALILLIREDTPAYLAVFGVYLFVTGKRALARQMLVVSVTYLGLVHALVMPLLRGGAPYVFDDRYGGLVRAGQAGKASVLETLGTNAAYTLNYVVSFGSKWEFIALVLLPVALLPIFSRRALILLVPGFAFSVLSSFNAQYSIEFHYTAPILPFLYFATMVTLARWERSRTTVVLAAVILATTCLLAGKLGRSPVMSTLSARLAAGHRTFYGATAARIHEVARAIPKDACVRATPNLLVPASERRGAYVVPWGKDCDWAILDYAADARQAPSTNAWEYVYMRERLRSGEFGIRYLDDRVVVMGRGEPTTRNQELLDRLEHISPSPPSPPAAP